MSISTESLSEDINLLQKYESEVLEHSEEILMALEENIDNVDTKLNREDVIFGLEQALKDSVPEEDRHSICHELMYLVSIFDRGYAENLRSVGFSSEFVDLTFKLGMGFSREANNVAQRAIQGTNSFSSPSSELVIRDSGSIGFNHSFLIDQKERVDISTNLNSNLRLVHYLLRQHNKAVDEFEEEAIEQTSDSALERVGDEWENLVDSINGAESGEGGDS